MRTSGRFISLQYGVRFIHICCPKKGNLLLFTHSVYSLKLELLEFCSRTLKLEATNQHRVNARKQQQLKHIRLGLTCVV